MGAESNFHILRLNISSEIAAGEIPGPHYIWPTGLASNCQGGENWQLQFRSA